MSMVWMQILVAAHTKKKKGKHAIKRQLKIGSIS